MGGHHRHDRRSDRRLLGELWGQVLGVAGSYWSASVIVGLAAILLVIILVILAVRLL